MYVLAIFPQNAPSVSEASDVQGKRSISFLPISCYSHVVSDLRLICHASGKMSFSVSFTYKFLVLFFSTF